MLLCFGKYCSFCLFYDACSVLDLTNTKNRFKVDVNAQQLHLTGGVLTCQEESINMVFVEGGILSSSYFLSKMYVLGPKSIKTYIKLMTRRIDWNLVLQDDDAEEDEKQDDEQPDAPKKENRCDLVWQVRVSFSIAQFVILLYRRVF